jgi:hypothetical protein
MTDGTLEIDYTSTTEEERIYAWRVHVLAAAGYPHPLAKLVADSTADLHTAERLVRDGCPPATAVRILT